MEKSHVLQGMVMLRAVYPNATDPNEINAQIWTTLLSDLKTDCYLRAIEYFCKTGGQFAPSLGQVRQLALRYQGTGRQRTAMEAWGRVWERFRDRSVELTDIEKQCLKTLGGEWTLRNSVNSNRDRADFCKLYDDLISRPAVDDSKALPEHTVPPEQAVHYSGGEESQHYTADETRALCRSVIASLDDRFGNR